MYNKKFSIGNILMYGVVSLLTFACLYPFINVVAVSFSSTRAVLAGEVTLFPIEFQTGAYVKVFKMKSIWQAMKVTVIVTLAGTATGLALTTALAYALSKSRLKGKEIINGFVLFTMFFGGGLIPTFIVIKELGLYNTLGALFIPQALGVYNFIIMRTFFRQIPKELEEAALIDGAGDIKVLVSIVLPLSKAILATIGLFYAVGYWNDYFSALMYTQSGELYTLQLRLRNLLFEGGMNSTLMLTEETNVNVQPEVMKRATIVISTVPILIVYPWLQKYFVKGAMLGSLKG